MSQRINVACYFADGRVRMAIVNGLADRIEVHDRGDTIALQVCALEHAGGGAVFYSEKRPLELTPKEIKHLIAIMKSPETLAAAARVTESAELALAGVKA